MITNHTWFVAYLAPVEQKGMLDETHEWRMDGPFLYNHMSELAIRAYAERVSKNHNSASYVYFGSGSEGLELFWTYVTYQGFTEEKRHGEEYAFRTQKH